MKEMEIEQGFKKLEIKEITNSTNFLSLFSK